MPFSIFKTGNFYIEGKNYNIMPAPVLNTKRGIQLEIGGTPHFLIENEESDVKKHFRGIKVNDAIYGHGELNFFYCIRKKIILLSFVVQKRHISVLSLYVDLYWDTLGDY